MAHVSVADKLKRVLYKFSDSNYKISGADDVYLQKLISLLTNSDNSKSENGHILARLPFCAEWLAHVANVWKDTSPHPSVASFSLRLAGVMVADQKKFASLHEAGTLGKLLASLELLISSSGSVAMAYVFLLTELLHHDDGCNWIVESGNWSRVIKLSLEGKCIQVCRDSHKLIGKLVVKLQSKQDSERCDKIINHILEPLHLAKGTGQGQAPGDNKDLVSGSVSLICNVLEAAMSEAGLATTLISLENHELESSMWQLMKLVDDEACVGRISKILVLLYFVLCTNMCSDRTPMCRNFCLKSKIFDILTYLTGKRHVKNILYVCFQCKVLFHKFNIKDLTFEDKSKQYELEDQLVFFQIMPILCLRKEVMTCNDVFAWQYSQKLFDISSEETVRLAYPMRDVLKSDYERISEFSKCAISYLMQLKNYLDKARAATVCQALAYALKSIVLAPQDEHMEKYSQVLPAILDGLSTLVEHFQISWRESVESLCLFSFVEELLKNSSLPPIVAVKALRLMQVTVQNYLPPNLALLVDTMGGSSIQELGPLLYRRLHDASWDVRDSALELLHTVTDISHINFPPFQEHIVENDLCSLTVALAMDDAESYVRTSALKCLGVMVKVPRYWDNCLSSQDLPSKMISILTEESEGLVRREAAQLMKEIYQHQSIPKSLETGVFAAMVSAATRDLYWEVKVNALCFWEKVIEQQMSHQGMIDGRFPAVTFSRENRKIVTLTEDEVKLRINKALEELGRLGCLQVLLSAIHDCDLQVVFKAVAITTSLSSLLSQYGILPAGSAASRCGANKRAQSGDDGTVPQNGDVRVTCDDGVVPDSDQVIENIVNESDISLLSQVYRSRTDVPDTSPDATVVPMKARDFLSALAAVNLQYLLAERTQWVDNCNENVNCLLDDMLYTHTDPENIITDCY